MAKHGRAKRANNQRPDSTYRPLLERLEERLPPGKLSLLDYGLSDWNQWTYSTQSTSASSTIVSAGTSGGSTTNGSAYPQYVPPPITDSGSTETGSPTSKLPGVVISSVGTSGLSSNDGLQTLDSLLNTSGGSLLLGGHNTASGGSTSSGFGSFTAAGPYTGTGSGGGFGGFTVGPAINVTRLIDSQSETSIGVDPSNPKRLVTQANDNGPLGRSVQAYSDDAYHTFRQGFTVDLGCPTVTYDQFGNLWRASLDTSLTGVDVAASADNARTFFFSTFLPNPFDPTQPVDQDRIKTGPSGLADVPYATWVEFTAVDPTTGALTPVAYPIPVFGWANAGPERAPEVVGPPGFNLTAMAIGPDGEASFGYCAANGNIFVASDLDGLGGGTPAIATLAARPNIPETGFSIPAQASRLIQPSPRLAYDRSSGPHRGRLYLTYTGVTVGTTDTNIFVAFSDSFGGSWSASRRINDDLTQNSQFFSDIAVDQTTGNLFVAWNDARNDLGRGGSGDTDHVPNTDIQVYGTVSIDGGLTWSRNQRISPGTSNGPSIAASPFGNGANQFGDYIGVDFDEGRGWVAWTDNSANPTGNFNRPLPDIVVASVLINRGSGYTTVGDRFETSSVGNDTSSAASIITLNPAVTDLTGLSIFDKATAPDQDWYRFVVPSTGVLTIDMTTIPAWPTEGQLGMRLYTRAANGSLVQVSVSEIPGSATPQEIIFPVVAGQMFYLYCHGFTGGGVKGTGQYSLHFSIV